MKDNTLLIHIGMPKTGTTALQKFLLDHSDMLQKFGWTYPVLSSDPIGAKERSAIESWGNGYFLYVNLILHNNMTKWNEEVEVVLKHLEKENVIISSENVYEDGTETFLKCMKEQYGNIKVVVYLRRQDRAIESLYNQFIKNGDEYNTFEKFIDSNMVVKQYLNYLSKLDLISQIIGKENLIVRIYERQQLVGNNIVPDFLSILGIALNNVCYENSHVINSSVQGNYLEINRLVNSVQCVDSLFGDKDVMRNTAEVQTDFYNVCMNLSQFFHEDTGEHGFFQLDERKAFIGQFAIENEQIARKYLQREEGILFYDSQMDYPVYKMNQYNDFEEDMIRFFAAMMYTQNQRFTVLLEKKVGEMIGRFLMRDISLKRKGRKLLLFGAGCNCRRLFDFVDDIPVMVIADNDVAKQGTVIKGVGVKHVNEIANWREYFVVVTCEKTAEIETQLCGLGLHKENDFILAKDYGL